MLVIVSFANKKMDAIVADRYGNPDILKLVNVEKPIPKDNEVLVKVKAATVNRTDCAILKGSPKIARLAYGLTKPKNNITGTDFAGIIESVERT
jgi:NADPH:quinone reductase-like Zn-dependent oxidoreductase